MVAMGITILFGSVQIARAQEIRWLSVGQLQSFIVDYGVENEYTPLAQDVFSWPTQYGTNQYTSRSKSLWIGSSNFYDPVEKKTKLVKVIGSGPRYDDANSPGMIFTKTIKLIGRTNRPTVIVDGTLASGIQQYDAVDEVDPNLPCDRMVVSTFNTSMGISVTKKVMAFTQQDHDSYFIYDYVFKNTGIYDAAGDVYKQDLNNLMIHFGYRYAFSGVTSTGWGSTWGAFSSEWGSSTEYNDFGRTYRTPPADGKGTDSLRGFYSFYGPSKDRLSNGISTYDQDWGCPNQLGGGVGINGVLGSAKYSGAVTLFAPNNTNRAVDDPTQPTTTSWFNTDDDAEKTPVSQYDDVYMQKRWVIMTEGHLPQSMEQAVGSAWVGDFWTANQSGRYGGAQGQGYGPYTLASGDSIHIVFVEGVSGLSWEACRSVGAVWYEYYKGSSAPPLKLPNGSLASSYTDYTKTWVQTGKDSLMQLFRSARTNYRSGYTLTQSPEPPSRFTVASGGDKISLTWTPSASSKTPIAGYVIYRSESNVKTYLSVYTKVLECPSTVTQWDDTSAHRGFKYFYYIQSKDDGSRNELHRGVPLYSSPFYTMTSSPAYLLKPAGNLLGEVRVVPNPYDIRSRKYQFADAATGLTGGIDQIMFYGLPPVCTIKIFTENGTLIREINHTNGAGDEKWDSKTSSGQLVVSGIYIVYFVVTQDVYADEDKIAKYDVRDEKLNVIFHGPNAGNNFQGDMIYHKGDKIFNAGQSTIRKFVVIR
jgi:hypothetical protein